MVQVQVDLSTPSASTATLRRNLMAFFDDNHKEFVPGGGTVIFLASEDPLKMTLGVVYTFSHNGTLLAGLRCDTCSFFVGSQHCMIILLHLTSCIVLQTCVPCSIAGGNRANT